MTTGTRFMASFGFAALAGLLATVGCDGGTSSGGTGGAGNNGGGGSGGTGGATGGTGGATGGTGGATGGTGGATGGSGGTGGMNPACVDAPGAPPALQLTPFVSGLDRPVLLTYAPGDPATRMFVIEQRGRIRIIENGQVLPTPFLDIDSLVQGGTGGGDERGLLGLAFHPNYAQNGKFYVYYTSDNNTAGFFMDFTIAEYTRSANDPNVAEPASAQVLIEEPDEFGNHNGGMMAFGPDGYLYVGVGDEGDGGDPNTNAQNPDVKFGKILRLDVDNYPTPPPGNLPNADPDVWDLGLRNPWRFSFDACTNRLYIGDVGQGQAEEVDIEEPGQGHKNYGWDCKEGNGDFEPGNCDPNTVLTPPVKTYTHGGGRCSISGGFVYRGSAIPGLRGHYFYGDYCTGQVWSFFWDGAALTQDVEHQSLNPGQFELGSFGQDAAGEIYVLELNSGNISRIDPG